MKKYILTILSLGLGLTISAQTLNIKKDGIFYSYPAEETGLMEYSSGKTLRIGGDIYDLSDIEKITTVLSPCENNLVNIVYNGDEAEVYISYDIAEYIEANINGAHVELTQSEDVGDETTGEITYRLSGETNDGSFLLNGSFKCSLELTGLNLKNPSGAAIDIENGKRIAIRVAEGTVNNLEDGVNGKQKACLYAKGHLEFKQKGTLNVTGNTSHAISCKEYVELKNTNLNVEGAIKDGINCAQYFLMESGTLIISGTGDDGIQTDYKDSENREKEDTGSITIKGGTLNIIVTNDASKALKAEGSFFMEGGTITASTSGNSIWDADKLKTKASACISADEDITVNDGVLILNSTGGGGKGISADGKYVSSGGEIKITTSGGLAAYVNGTMNQNYTGNTDRIASDYKSSPKGIKIDGDIEIDGGDYDIHCSGYGGEGIESKSNLTVSSGKVKVRAYDDGTNSLLDTYLNGGDLDIMSIGSGDGVDSNGNIYVGGGRIQVYGARSPEQGFDAGDGYQIYITGGEILAIGGGNSVPSRSQSTQAFITLAQSVAAGDVVTVSDSESTLMTFTVANDYTGGSSNGGNGGGPGWKEGWGPGGFGGMGPGFLVSGPQLEAGKTYTVKIGSSSYSATAKLTN